MQNQIPTFKLLLVGDGGTGKVCRRILFIVFDEDIVQSEYETMMVHCYNCGFLNNDDKFL